MPFRGAEGDRWWFTNEYVDTFETCGYVIDELNSENYTTFLETIVFGHPVLIKSTNYPREEVFWGGY